MLKEQVLHQLADDLQEAKDKRNKGLMNRLEETKESLIRNINFNQSILSKEKKEVLEVIKKEVNNTEIKVSDTKDYYNLLKHFESLERIVKDIAWI